MNKIFTFALAIFFTSCASIEQPLPAPSSLTWQHVGGMSYESQNPGLGESQRYASSAGWIDVYTYSLGRNDWKPGVSDPQFTAHFESTITEVRLAEQQGIYADLKIDTTRDVTVSGNIFRTVSFRFSRDGKPITSATFLTAQNGQLLKYRVSLYAASGLDVVAVAQSFIEENLRSGQVNPSRNGKGI